MAPSRTRIDRNIDVYSAVQDAPKVDGRSSKLAVMKSVVTKHGDSNSKARKQTESTSNGSLSRRARLKDKTKASMKSATTAPVPDLPRIPYNTGYGDFCLGRLIDRQTKSVYSGKTFSDEDLRYGSNCVRPKELDGFKRSGPFPFFKLPIEIRNPIYDLLLAPFRTCSNSHTKLDILALKVSSLNESDLEGSFVDDYSGGFNTVLAKKGDVITQETSSIPRQVYQPEVISAKERQEMECEYLKEHEEYLLQRRPHPSRTTQYKLEPRYARPFKTHLRRFHDNKDWLLIDWLRRASNVSTQFRKELGDALFRSVALSCERRGDFYALKGFLEERPAIQPGIKKLAIEICGDSGGWRNDIDAGPFLEVCQYLATHLALDEVKITLGAQIKEIEEFASTGEGRFAFLKAARELNVAKRFVVEAGNVQIPETDFGTDEDEEEWLEQFEKTNFKKIKEWIYPDSLRVDEMVTDMDVYLHARPHEAPSLCSNGATGPVCTKRL